MSHPNEDAPVDAQGRPLPLVVLVSPDGAEVAVRDAHALTNLHYGLGFDFAEKGQTYPRALAVLLGEDHADQVMVEEPAEPAAGQAPVEQESAPEGGRRKKSESD